MFSIVITEIIGIGIALDATLVRGLLVPAAMRLLGRWNWWAPRPAARLQRKISLEGPSASPDQHEGHIPAHVDSTTGSAAERG